MEIVEVQKSQSPPHQGHRDELLKKSNPLCEANPLPLDLIGGSSSFDLSVGSQNAADIGLNNALRLRVDNRKPMLNVCSNQVSVEHRRLLAEVSVLYLVQIVRDRLVNNPSEICMSSCYITRIGSNIYRPRNLSSTQSSTG
jgi:hypothetical protein